MPVDILSHPLANTVVSPMQMLLFNPYQTMPPINSSGFMPFVIIRHYDAYLLDPVHSVAKMDCVLIAIIAAALQKCIHSARCVHN